MLVLLSFLATAAAFEPNVKSVPSICITEVSQCSDGYVQGQGVDGTYCYDSDFNIKEKIERSGRNFEEVDRCSPDLQQGKSVLMPFCVNEMNIPQQKLKTAFDQMDKVSVCSEGLRQGEGAYKRFCFDDENNIVQLIHNLEDKNNMTTNVP